jgi:hypothetical protein
MIRVLMDGHSVVICRSLASAQEFVARHPPALQKRMEIRVTHERLQNTLTNAQFLEDLFTGGHADGQ